MVNGVNNKVLKAGAGYVIGNYLLKGITFLSAPIFSRLLSPQDFGDFSTYMSYEAILYIFVGLALHSSINNAKYTYENKLDEYVSSIICLDLASFVGWLVLVNLLYDRFVYRVGFERVVINILICHCLASSLYQIYNTYIGLQYNYKSFVIISWIYAISNIVLSVILIITIFDEDRSSGRIMGTSIPMLLVGIYIFIFFMKKAKPKIDLGYWKFGLNYSLPIIPHGVAQVVLSSFDRIMIRNMIGAAEAGIYSFAYTIYQIAAVASNSLQNVWKPWMYEKMESKEYDVIRKRGTDYAFGMGIFTALVLIGSPEMIKVLGDQMYWKSANCVIPVVLGGYFAFLYTLPVLVEYFYSKTKYIALGTIGAALLNVILNYLFLPRFGYIAAAYTTLIAYALYFCFHYVIAMRIHGSSLFNTKVLFLISFGVVVIGVLALALRNQWMIRWTIEVFLGCYAVYWLNSELHLIDKIRQKISK